MAMQTFEEQLEEYLELRAQADRGEYQDLPALQRFWRLAKVPGILGAAWRLQEAAAAVLAAAKEEEEWSAALELAAKAEGESEVCTCGEYWGCAECEQRASRDYCDDEPVYCCAQRPESFWYDEPAQEEEDPGN